MIELAPVSQGSLSTAFLIARVSIVLVSVEGRIGMGGFLVDKLLDLFREIGETGDSCLDQAFLHKVIKLLISILQSSQPEELQDVIGDGVNCCIKKESLGGMGLFEKSD